jgi:Ca2+-binding EF-hand superfamily protein
MMAAAPILVRRGCLAAAVTLAVMGGAMAQQADDATQAGFYDRFAFEAADTDGDDLISEAELARDTAAGFSGLDEDRDLLLTPQELGPHDPAMFAAVDSDGDGKLTFMEVMTHKVRGFEAGDVNKDGYLSFEEMIAAVKSELGAE